MKAPPSLSLSTPNEISHTASQVQRIDCILPRRFDLEQLEPSRRERMEDLIERVQNLVRPKRSEVGPYIP